MTSAPLSIIAKAAPLALGELRVERFGWTYAAGDKVMQVENDDDKDVYNGDLGLITRIDPEQGEVEVTFEGREVTYDLGELDEVVPAYATTVPNAQGAGDPAVVVPLVTQHSRAGARVSDGDGRMSGVILRSRPATSGRRRRSAGRSEAAGGAGRPRR